jgi:hypothetical protein
VVGGGFAEREGESERKWEGGRGGGGRETPASLSARYLTVSLIFFIFVVSGRDVRMVQERLNIDAGPHAVNKLALDRSGTVLAVASEDHSGVPLCHHLSLSPPC